MSYTSPSPTPSTVAAMDQDHQVDAALAELRRGRMVLVVDDEDRENEGDLIAAAELATPEMLAFVIRHTSGLVCVGMDAALVDRLELPPMVAENDDPRATAFTVSVDLRNVTSTGVSATVRAATIRALADPGTRPGDLSRPGHIVPLRAREGGVLRRAGHTESAVDLCRLAGLAPAGLLAEVTNPDGTMARRPELARFAQRHGLVSVTVADLVRYRLRTDTLVVRQASGRVPSPHGEFTVTTYRSELDGSEHVALVMGDVSQAEEPAPDDNVLVRVHSECLTGDVFGSRRCDCGEQLQAAMERIGTVGRGAVVYLRGHEGRGIGLSHKLRAYTLQDGAWTPSRRTSPRGCPWTAASTGSAHRSCVTSGCDRSA